ncbi:MAG: hypothetical protein JO279_13530, partial [Verrucomicrobia bacterium]|nr:hypothetical protein [Verrucomicrobiota bacterium]
MSSATPKEPLRAPIGRAKEAASLPSSLSLAGKRAVAVVFSSYPSDPRPRRGAEALAREGASVEVICLKETDEEPKRESFNGIDVTRVPLRHYRGGKLSYVRQYAAFLFMAASKLIG